MVWCITGNTSWMVVSHLCLLWQLTHTHCMQYDWHGKHNSEGWKLQTSTTSQCKCTLVFNLNLIKSRLTCAISKSSLLPCPHHHNQTIWDDWLCRLAPWSFFIVLVPADYDTTTSCTGRGIGTLTSLKLSWAFARFCIVRCFTCPLVWPFALDFPLGPVFPFTTTGPLQLMNRWGYLLHLFCLLLPISVPLLFCPGHCLSA